MQGHGRLTSIRAPVQTRGYPRTVLHRRLGLKRARRTAGYTTHRVTPTRQALLPLKERVANQKSWHCSRGAVWRVTAYLSPIKKGEKNTALMPGCVIKPALF